MSRENGDGIVSVTGPVDWIDGELALMIPLAVGGDALRESCKSISTIDGDYLNVVIQSWLAEKIGVKEDSIVTVDNAEGRFNIYVQRDDDASTL